MMNEHGSPPRARRDSLLEETLGDELLLYDQNNDTAHCLSPIAAAVWRHCDGEHDVTELALLAGTSEDLVANALRELREQDLLDAESELAPGESRREAIGRVARYGAAAAGTSMIVSAAAATPAMASSGEEARCANCKVEWANCCEEKESFICCCCENGIALTAVPNISTCEEACNGVQSKVVKEKIGFKSR